MVLKVDRFRRSRHIDTDLTVRNGEHLEVVVCNNKKRSITNERWIVFKHPTPLKCSQFCLQGCFLMTSVKYVTTDGAQSGADEASRNQKREKADLVFSLPDTICDRGGLDEDTVGVIVAGNQSAAR